MNASRHERGTGLSLRHLLGKAIHSNARQSIAPSLLLTVCLLGSNGPVLNSTAGPAWEQHSGYRVAHLQVAATGRTGFTLLTPEQTGVHFTNVLSDQYLAMDSTLLGGSGVALGDIDGDGRCDIYLCSLAGRNALYRNLGNWRFEEVAEAAGVACPDQISRGAVFADVDGNGTLDLLVTARNGGIRLFLNDGAGHFHEAPSAQSGLPSNTGSTSMALADVDGNGTLDLYVANFGVSVLRDGGHVAFRMVNGKMVITGRYAKKIKIIDGQLVEFGEPDALYLNDGHGHFTQVPWDQGAFLDEKGQPIQAPWDFGLTVQMRDLDGDGWPDIYVCNDFFTPDRIWINDRHGHFRAIDTLAIRKMSFASMGVDFADIDRDGHMDGLIVEMLARDPGARLRQMTPDLSAPPILGGLDRQPQIGRNTLLWNRGDGTFAEIAQFAGLAASDWSWMPIFLDVDLDGYEDVLIANGATYDLLDLDVIRTNGTQDGRNRGHSAKSFPRIETPNCAFRNNGNRTFTECGRAWGFDSRQASTGMALGDLDNDGDLDVVVNCLNGGALLYRNESTTPRIAVRLRGLPPNTQGIGAMVIVRGGAVPFQSQEIISGGRFLSGDAPIRAFAAGTPANVLTLEVAWRSGRQTLITNAEPNCLYEIDEDAASATRSEIASKSPPSLFEDVSAALGHRHVDPPWDDFSRQKSLPKRLSQLGPAVAWFDLNGDGRDDLVIGAGRGTAPAVFLNSGPLPWARLGGDLTNTLLDDSAGIVGGTLKPGMRSLLVGLAHYENDSSNVPSAFRFDWTKDLTRSTAVPAVGLASRGPLALADLTGSGRLDLFISGRSIAGRYPEAADSLLFRNQDGALVPDPSSNAILAKAGLVTGAVFTDLDADCFPDLVLACEWGPIRVFKNNRGHLQEWDAPLVGADPTAAGCAFALPDGVSKLSEFLGGWTCLATGDFDGDGLIDIAAGNWGLNTAYQPVGPGPWFLYYGDFNEDGSIHILEAYRNQDLKEVMPFRDLASVETDLPWLRAAFPTHHAYSKATLPQLLGDRVTKSQRLEARILHSVVLLNRGGKFEVRALPPEVQWSPVMGLAVGDLDGDGHEDLFVSQNFFAVRPGDERWDSGRGLLLLGDGHGGFSSVPGQTSGILIYGEQRGCALADYDADGRLDLVVAQNNAETRLFHNQDARPGLRVRLLGPPGNPDGIGATLRLEFAGRLGPAREIQAGTGCGSQNSSAQVLATPTPPTAIQVRWPGGNTVRSELPPSAREVQVSPDGTIKVARY